MIITLQKIVELDNQELKGKRKMKKLKLALDWTPNVNHIGFYVAKTLGFYQEAGIDLEILNPKDDNYALTPGKKLELDLADFAIAPFETVISLNNKPKKVNAVAIYAILQEDLSCIVSLKSSDINHPSQLDGKSYASYKARYEDHIVRQLIVNAGGKGDLKIMYPEKLGIWNTLLEGKADSTWIFDNWEGVEATAKNVALNKFSLKQFNIPYGYSPVVLTKKENMNNHFDDYGAFVKATRRGFLHAKKNEEEAVSILEPHLTSYDKENVPLSKSLRMTAGFFGDEKNCGRMSPERLSAFFHWIVNHGLENKGILDQDLFTNSLLDG